MEAYARLGGKAPPIVRFLPDEIAHLSVGMAIGCSQRPPNNRAHVVLELADLASIDRPVATVVHARRNLVDDQRLRVLTAHIEHFDGQYTDVIESGGNLFGNLARTRLMRRRKIRGYRRRPQDSAFVVVEGNVIEAGLARSVTHNQNGDLASKPHDGLKHGRPAANFIERGGHFFCIRDAHLPLAIVAEPARL